MRDHDKPVQCPREGCNHRAAWNKDINRHVWSHHADWARARNWPSQEKTCDICGMVLGRGDVAKRHMAEQHGNTPRNRGQKG
jgi:uncharacterized C2H2 Zn-finger protein